MNLDRKQLYLYYLTNYKASIFQAARHNMHFENHKHISDKNLVVGSYQK